MQGHNHELGTRWGLRLSNPPAGPEIARGSRVGRVQGRSPRSPRTHTDQNTSPSRSARFFLTTTHLTFTSVAQIDPSPPPCIMSVRNLSLLTAAGLLLAVPTTAQYTATCVVTSFASSPALLPLPHVDLTRCGRTSSGIRPTQPRRQPRRARQGPTPAGLVRARRPIARCDPVTPARSFRPIVCRRRPTLPLSFVAFWASLRRLAWSLVKR